MILNWIIHLEHLFELVVILIDIYYCHVFNSATNLYVSKDQIYNSE